MSFKEAIRAGESGGRKAAVREELLPSQHPLTKPTRDISASNRSHSITREDPPIFASDKRLLFLQRQAEQVEYEKQANIVYTRQFRSLAKLLGNEGMQFDELREKIESLVLKDIPTHPDPVLFQRIQNLQRQLAKKNVSVEVGRSSQSLPSSHQYLRGLEHELGRKSKIINELSDSIKREAFQEAFRNLQAEIDSKTMELKILEQQFQEGRIKANANITILEEELIKLKQTIQKLTFQLDTLKRKSQNSIEDIQRLKRREKELISSLQTETKANYQGLSYSTHALLMQLQARDQQISTSINEQNFLQQQLYNLRQEQIKSQDLIKKAAQDLQSLQNKLEYEESQKERLQYEIEHVTKQLQNSHVAVSSANNNQQMLLNEKQRLEQNLEETIAKLQEYELNQTELRADRNNCVGKISQLQEVVGNLNIHIGQARSEVTAKDQELIELRYNMKEIQAELNQKLRILHSQQEQFELKNGEIYDLKQQVLSREQQLTQQIDKKSRQLQAEIEQINSILNSEKNLNHEYYAKITELASRNQFLQSELLHFEENITQQSRNIAQKDQQILAFQHRLEAVQQEKEILLQRLEDVQREYSEINQKLRKSEQSLKSKSGLELEITTRLEQQHQLRNLLDEAVSKQAQLQADIYQKDIILKDIQEQKKKDHGLYQQEISNLTRFIQELQEQLENEKHNQQLRLEEQYRVRDQLQGEIQSFRQNLKELEGNHREQLNIQQNLQSQAQQISFDLQQQIKKEHLQKQQIIQENTELRSYHEELRQTLNQQNEKLHRNQQRQQQIVIQFQSEKQRLEHEISELHYIIEEIKNEKTDLQKQLQMTKKTRENELASFSFNHFESEQQESPNKLRGIIEDLEQKLETYQREQQRIRLSYSHTLQASPTAIFGSLQSENQLLQMEKQRMEEELQHYRSGYLHKQNEISQLSTHIQEMNSQLQQYKILLEEQDMTIQHIKNQAKERQMTDAHSRELAQAHFSEQRNQLSEVIKQKQSEFITLKQRYDEEVQKVERLEHELDSIRTELERIREAREVKTVTLQLEQTKFELAQTVSQVMKLRQQISLTFRELEAARQTVEQQKLFARQMQKKAEQFESKVSELQEKVRKASRQQFQEPQRNLSRLSKGSNVSLKEHEENRSKAASSDGELSRRILNDPSKISGQQSKFAHNLLVFESSKIHVARQTVQTEVINQQREIKQQRQEQSVLSKQQLQNRTPQSSHRQINTTHFDRHSNENSKKDIRESQQIINNINQSIRSEEKKGNETPQQRSHIHSLASIHQAEEVQEASALPAYNNSSISSNNSRAKQGEVRPKQYLPQQSSKKIINNPNESKQNISIDQEVQKHSFQRISQHNNVPIYVARPSPLQPLPQERAEGSESRSGSKTKVRISYGQPSDKSIELKRRQVPRQMIISQVSRASMQSNKMNEEHSINQVSPIPIRTSNVQGQTSPSLFSSQRRENLQSRQSNHNQPVDQPSQSIINGINQLGSRLSTYGNARISNVQVPKSDANIRRESSPIYPQPRIDTVVSPRHSNINFNIVRNSTYLPSNFKPAEPIKTVASQRGETKKYELAVPPSKIVMRSVIGGKRNSLLNDTATFGKSSQKGAPWQNEAFSQSNDSGIDVLQMDWMAPCCKNE